MRRNFRYISLEFQPVRGAKVTLPRVTKSWKLFAWGTMLSTAKRDLQWRGSAISALRNANAIHRHFARLKCLKQVIWFSVKISTRM